MTATIAGLRNKVSTALLRGIAASEKLLKTLSPECSSRMKNLARAPSSRGPRSTTWGPALLFPSPKTSTSSRRVAKGSYSDATRSLFGSLVSSSAVVHFTWFTICRLVRSTEPSSRVTKKGKYWTSFLSFGSRRFSLQILVAVRSGHRHFAPRLDLHLRRQDRKRGSRQREMLP